MDIGKYNITFKYGIKTKLFFKFDLLSLAILRGKKSFSIRMFGLIIYFTNRDGFTTS